MKKLSQWVFVHALHWALLYGAFFENIEGAMYVLKFWVWVTAAFCWSMILEKSVEDQAKKPATPIRFFLGMAQAWITLFTLLWFGHIVSGVAWFLVIVCALVAADKVREKRIQLAKGEGNV